MKAMVITANGPPEVFQEQELPIPEPAADQLLVEVHAVSVNPVDYKIRRSGLFGYGPGSVLGFDAAGIVKKVGAAVRDFKLGDAVFYCPDFSGPGANAQYHVTTAATVAPKPVNLSFIEAAAVPLAAMTAWDGLMERGGLRLGQTILIHGASGGVGSWAVQLAHAAGAYVFGVCSAANVALVRSLGADYVIDRRQRDFAEVVRKETAGDGVDLVYDCVGGDVVARSMDLVKPMGRIVTIVNPSGDLSLGYRKNLSLHYEFLRRRKPYLMALKSLLERQIIKPVISRVLPLEQVAQAHRALEAGGGFGKIVLTVGH